MVTARIAGLSPGTSPPPVRIPIRPFLVLMRPLCRFLRACKRKIDVSDWMCKSHRLDETVYGVTNSRCNANPSSDRVFFRRRCTDSTLQRITTAKRNALLANAFGVDTRLQFLPLLCNCFNIYRSYQQFFAGYDKNFAQLCVEHHLLRLRNRLVFEAIGIVFFDVCFYRFCLGVVSETTDVPVHFVLRQDTQ